MYVFYDRPNTIFVYLDEFQFLRHMMPPEVFQLKYEDY
jgi:hypothetical protein